MIKINLNQKRNDMKAVDIFRIPMYTFKFKDYKKYHPIWKEYNEEYQHYVVNRDSKVSLSLPNFHKKDIYAPLTNFFRECLNDVVAEISDHGFDIDITAMWSTIQHHGGQHHVHTHNNCMFVGTYYLYSDVEDSRGTLYHNIMSDFRTFKMDGMYGGKGKPYKTSTTWYDRHHQVPFEEGKLVIYPGWMRHSGMPHPGNNRQIIAFNAMPIGALDEDPLQRYRYADFRDDTMEYDDK